MVGVLCPQETPFHAHLLDREDQSNLMWHLAANFRSVQDEPRDLTLKVRTRIWP